MSKKPLKNRWDNPAASEMVTCPGVIDLTFPEGAFFQNDDIAYRDISEILHPYISESISLLEKLRPEEKKIYFKHSNHTNL